MVQWLKPAIVLGLSLNLSAAFAEGLHDGDILPTKSGSVIAVNGETSAIGNYFEADFGDFAGGLFRTGSPGFDLDSASGPFGAGNVLWFEGLGTLSFWNGSVWTAAPNGENIRIKDALGESSIFSSNGITQAVGAVGQISNGGSLHEHLEYAIYNASNALGGSVGAYWITLKLLETTLSNTSTVLAESEPFHLFFNRGLSHVDFDAAIDAAVVPVPAAVWMFGSALVGWLSLGRRRSGLTA